MLQRVPLKLPRNKEVSGNVQKLSFMMKGQRLIQFDTRQY